MEDLTNMLCAKITKEQKEWLENKALHEHRTVSAQLRHLIEVLRAEDPTPVKRGERRARR